MANSYAMRRWAPTVVPGLAPTGAFAVGSFRPSPSGSTLSRTSLAAEAWAAKPTTPAIASDTARRVLFIGRASVRVVAFRHRQGPVCVDMGGHRAHQAFGKLHRHATAADGPLRCERLGWS